MLARRMPGLDRFAANPAYEAQEVLRVGLQLDRSMVGINPDLRKNRGGLQELGSDAASGSFSAYGLTIR